MKVSIHNKITMIALLLCSAIIFSCKKDTLQKISSGELIDRPTEEIINVKLVYTYDGQLRNEMTARKAVKYQNGDTVLYIFPEGIHMISYKDSIPESDLVADSATLNDCQGLLFTAIGNVVAKNIITNKKLITDGPLFWDEKNKTVETKVYSEIYSETDTIYAKYGVFADDRFREVEMRGQSGVMYRDVQKQQTDSANVISNTE
jgi:LPS export ABC transporter protein LptC